MAVTLAIEDKAKLRKFLEQQYNLEEMKNLAFDLGIDYNRLPHETTVELSRELLSYCERMGLERNLVAKMLTRQHGEEREELARLLAKLPASDLEPKFCNIMLVRFGGPC
jgi:hypothetical protein